MIEELLGLRAQMTSMIRTINEMLARIAEEQEQALLKLQEQDSRPRTYGGRR